jgi:hypothetical protein
VFAIRFGMLTTGDYITQKIGPKNRKKKTTDLKGEDSATFSGKLICRFDLLEGWVKLSKEVSLCDGLCLEGLHYDSLKEAW